MRRTPVTIAVLATVVVLLAGVATVYDHTVHLSLQSSAANQSAVTASSLSVESGTGLQPEAGTNGVQGQGVVVQPSGTVSVQEGVAPPAPRSPICEERDQADAAGCLPSCRCETGMMIMCPLDTQRTMIAQPICPETMQN